MEINKTGLSYWKSDKVKKDLNLFIIVNSAMYVFLILFWVKEGSAFVFAVMSFVNILSFEIYNKIHNPCKGLSQDVNEIDKSIHSKVMNEIHGVRTYGKLNNSRKDMLFHMSLMKLSPMVTNIDINKYRSNNDNFSKIRIIVSFIWFATFVMLIII